MDMWKWFEGWLDDQEVCIGPISHILHGSAFIKTPLTKKNYKKKRKKVLGRYLW